MSWNDCTYITQSNSTEVKQETYQAAYTQCVGEIAMSSSMYITEVSESKLYIISGSQSGSLIYTSAAHGLEDDEEVGHYETGSFCHKCKGYFRHHGRENLQYYHPYSNISIPKWEYEISQSNGELTSKDEKIWKQDDISVYVSGSVESRVVESGSNLDIVHRLWTD